MDKIKLEIFIISNYKIFLKKNKKFNLNLIKLIF